MKIVSILKRVGHLAIMAVVLTISPAFFPREVHAQEKYLETHMFFSSKGAVNGSWYGLRHDYQGKTVTNMKEVYIKDPNNRDVAAQYFRINLTSMSSLEFSWYELAVKTGAENYAKKVYPFAAFVYKADRDAFINGKAGKLDWRGIDKTRQVRGIGEFGLYAHSGFYDGGGGTLFLRNRSFLGGTDKNGNPCNIYVVMEEHDYMPNAVKTTAKLRNQLTISEDGAYYLNDTNYVDVTYTNAAPYPVYAMLIEPKVNCKDNSHPGLYLWEYKDNHCDEIKNSSYNISSDGRYIYQYLLPGEKVTLTWGVRLVYRTEGEIPNAERVGSDIYGKPRYNYYRLMPAKDNASFNISATTAVLTVPPKKISEMYEWKDDNHAKYFNLKGAEHIVAQAYSTLPGNLTNAFNVLGAHPTNINSTQNEKVIQVLLSSATRLKDINVQSADGSITYKTYNGVGSLTKVEEGIYSVDVSDVGNAAAENRLLVTSLQNDTFKIPFETASNYEVYVPSNTANRLVLVQDENGKFEVYPYEPLNYNEEKMLLNITGFAEKDGDNAYKIYPGAIVNGVLTISSEDNSSTSPVARLTWNNSTAELKPINSPKKSRVIYNQKYKIAEENYQILLSSSEVYENVVSDDEDIQPPKLTYTSGNELYVISEKPIANMDGFKIYKDAISVSGNISMDDLLTGIFRTFIDAELNMDDIRFDANGFRGAAGDASGHIGINDPFGMIGANADMDIWFNTLPDAEIQKVGAAGSFNIGPLIAVDGSIEFADVFNEYEKASGAPSIWFLNSLYAEYAGPLPVFPALSITLGAGFSGFVEMVRMNNSGGSGFLSELEENCIPPFQLKGTLGIGDATGLIIEGKGSLNLGFKEFGLTDGSFSLFSVPNLITDATATIGFVDTHKKLNISGSVALPLVRTELNLSGNMNLYNIFKGSAAVSLSIDPTKSRYGDNSIAGMYDVLANLDLSKNTASNIRKMQVAGGKIGDIIYDMVDVSYSGKVALTMPEGLPFAGTEFASAEVRGNKYYVRAEARAGINKGFSIFGKEFSINEEIYAWVNYSFESDKTTGGAGTSFLKTVDVSSLKVGSPILNKMHIGKALNADGKSVEYSFTTNFIPVVKNTKKGLLKVFSGTYANTQTQVLAAEYNAFSILLRAKSSQTNIMITGPGGITAGRTASDLDWKQPDGKDYYEATVALKKDADAIAEGILFAGTWTVKTYNNELTAADANGRIDCDFFYVAEPAVVSNLAYDNGNFSWTNNKLEENKEYRVSFALVDGLDSTLVYPIAATAKWSEATPLENYALVKAFADIEVLPSGNYYVQATLEMYAGEVNVLDDEGKPIGGEPHALWYPVSSAYSGATFAHVNPKEPGAVTAVTAVAIGNGQAKITWTPPTSTDNVSGFTVAVKDVNGKEVIQYTVDSTLTEYIIEASNDISEYTDTGLYVIPSAVKFDSVYTFTVNAFYKNWDANTFVNGKGTTSGALSIAEPNRPNIFQLAVTTSDGKDKTLLNSSSGGLPPSNEKIAGFNIYLRSDDTLSIYCGQTLNNAELKISEELSSYAGGYSVGMPLSYTNFSQVTQDNHIANISFNGVVEGEYLLSVKVVGVTNDFNTYSFRLFVDNTPPILLLTDRTRDEESGRWVISGTTEPDASLLFNGKDITGLLNAGAFSLIITEDEPILSFQAKDLAGNVTSTGSLSSVLQLPDDDDTRGVVVELSRNVLLMAETDLVAQAKLRKNDNSMVNPQVGDVVWSILQGSSLQINSTTGSITPIKVGETTIRATYKGVLSDVAVIIVKESATINDLYVASVTSDRAGASLSFTEPEGVYARGSSMTKDVVSGKILQFSFDQQNWQDMTAGVTFDNAGNAIVTGLDSMRTYYFRIKVAEGHNAGESNTTGSLGVVSSTPTSFYSKVTFSGDGIETYIQEIYYNDTIAISDTIPTREGYLFEGWYCGDTLWNFSTSVVDDMTLVAKWTKIGATGIADQQQLDVKLYPNPTSDMVTISGVKEGKVISLVDINGRIHFTIRASGEEETISIGRLPEGVYLLRIMNGSSVRTLKVVKQ